MEQGMSLFVMIIEAVHTRFNYYADVEQEISLLKGTVRK